MMKITPLFCKPLIEVNIDIDTKNIEKTFSKFELEKHNNSNLLHLSLDMNVLKKFTKLKKIIDKVIKDVNSNVWKIDKELMITTSWLTKTEKGGESLLHNHLNSMFSGVFYFQDSSPIEFSHIRTNTIYDPPLENNVYNSSQWILNPKQNDLILFPSELNHQIKKSTIEETRYSIAFNVLPKGLLGYKDSIIKIGEI